MTRITVVRGDLTTQEVDAIVNAANSGLLGGGGVDGAIHRAGGRAILEECRHLRATSHREGLPTGQAVATTAGDMPAGHVIHTVGPVHRHAGADAPRLLADCYRHSLDVARELGARTVAFPSISTGVYGYPIPEAGPIARRTVEEYVAAYPEAFDEIRFVVTNGDAERAYA